MSGKCCICLCAFKEPLSIPCGHVYCTKCLADHVNAPGNDDITSSCPTCRTEFNTVTPDLTYLPKKYHQYVLPSVRRVYLDTSEYTNLKKKLTKAETRIQKLEQDQEKLLLQCEQYMAAAHAHQEGEREATLRAKTVELERDRIFSSASAEKEASARHVREIENDYDLLTKKYYDLRCRSRELETRLYEGNAESSTVKRRKSKSSLGPLPSRQVDDNNTQADASGVAQEEAALQRRRIRPLPRARMKQASKMRQMSPPPHFSDYSKRPRLSEPIKPPRSMMVEHS